jgi:HTH-type transcriptional regulator / antitoxin HigA
MNITVQQTITHWGHVTPYTQVPHNKTEYEKLLKFMDELMTWSTQHKDERATSLLRLVAQNIETYETEHFKSKKASAIDMLSFFMEEHGLNQSDLPEIGSQSLVSKILTGERQLTVEHIRRLAKKFNVSPAVFC